MKRFCALPVLMLLASPAYAGESFSFVFGGHHIHIETSRNCRSASCVSVSIPGVYEKHARRDRYDDDDTRTTPPAAHPAPPTAAGRRPRVPPAASPPAAPVRPIAPPVVAAAQPQLPPPPVQ